MSKIFSVLPAHPKSDSPSLLPALTGARSSRRGKTLRSPGDSSSRCPSEHAGGKHRTAPSPRQGCVFAHAVPDAGSGGAALPGALTEPRPRRRSLRQRPAPPPPRPLPPTLNPPPRQPISGHGSARPRSLLDGCPLLASPIGGCPPQGSRGLRPLVYHSCPVRARRGLAPPLFSSHRLPLAARNAPSVLRLVEVGRRYFKKGLRARGASEAERARRWSVSSCLRFQSSLTVRALKDRFAHRSPTKGSVPCGCHGPAGAASLPGTRRGAGVLGKGWRCFGHPFSNFYEPTFRCHETLLNPKSLNPHLNLQHTTRYI